MRGSYTLHGSTVGVQGVRESLSPSFRASMMMEITWSVSKKDKKKAPKGSC